MAPSERLAGMPRRMASMPATAPGGHGALPQVKRQPSVGDGWSLVWFASAQAWCGDGVRGQPRPKEARQANEASKDGARRATMRSRTGEVAGRAGQVVVHVGTLWLVSRYPMSYGFFWTSLCGACAALAPLAGAEVPGQCTPAPARRAITFTLEPIPQWISVALARGSPMGKTHDTRRRGGSGCDPNTTEARPRHRAIAGGQCKAARNAEASK
ncbi:hypothetical protein FHS02_002006 [Massilia umbonata]|uniref:Uncharacterized protein n=1 Tax=Pseudoduganella umbonata TaxID=864828 RepID=A0A7W5HC15_9BURK|nr:hypothetical protein [Pseudoduganella umbonata]